MSFSTRERMALRTHGHQYRLSMPMITRLMVLAVAPVTALLAAPAQAANLTWDANGASPAAPVDGAGNWDTTTAWWSNGTTDGAWDNLSTAVFGNAGTAGTVTIDDASGTVSAAGLTFKTTVGNYTIAASGTDTLTLLGASPVISVAAGQTATINAPLVGSAGMTVNGNLTLGGVSPNFSGPINISAGATVLVKGNNGNGTAASATAAWAALGFPSNTETVGPYSSLGSVAPGTGNITIANGGTLSLNSGSANTVNFGQKVIFVQGTGATGAGAIINSTTANIRQFAAFEYLTLTGDALFSGGRMDIGRDGDPNNLVPDVLDLAGHTLTLNMTTSTQPMFGVQAFPNGKGNNIGTTITAGNIVVQAGTLDIETNTNAPSAANSTITFAASTTLGANLSANLELFKDDGMSCTRAMVFQGNNVIGPGAAASAATLASNITITGALGFEANVSGALAAGTGNASITLTGNITQNGNASVTQLGATVTILAGTNNWTGGTDIEKTGIITLASAGAFPTATPLSFGAVSAIGGTFDLGGFNATVSSLAVGSGAEGNSIIGNSSTTASSTLIYAGNVSTPSTFGGIIQDSVTTLINVGSLPVAQTGNQTTGLRVTSGVLTLTNANTYTGNTNVNGGELDIGSGGSIASATIAVAHGGTFAVLSGSNITTTPNVTNNGTVNLNTAAQTFGSLNGTGGAINLNTTVLTINGTGAYSGSINDNATSGGVIIAGTQITDGINVTTLTVNGALQIRSNGTSTGTSKIGALVLGSPGTLDLTNNKLVVEDSANHATTLATLKSEAASGAPTNPGIFSSTANSKQQIVVVDNAVAGLTTFGGATTDPGSILVVDTFKGDANLDGVVNISDLNIVAAHWQKSASDWSLGDFNGDGIVNIADLNIVAANWQAGAGAGSGESLASLPSVGIPSSVPEPTSLAMLGVSGLLLLKRRK